MRRTGVLVALLAVMAGAVLFAQDERLASPSGTAATEIRGKYDTSDEPIYTGGKWLEIVYGRPIKRSRDLWGSGADYGKKLNAGAPVWRAGANVSTRFKNELPIVIAGRTIAPGEYSLFIELKPNDWTLIVSGWAAHPTYPGTKDALFGAYEYTPSKDIARAKMTLGTLPFSTDQLTWSFLDMSEAGGKMAIMWDKVIASVPFTVK